MARKAAAPEPKHAAPPLPSPGSWAALALLGTASALWALFLWAELLVSRAGGTPFCALSAASDCSAVWDSAFASSVHRMTGLPVAAWGLAWSLVALLMPFLGLLKHAEDRPRATFVTATRVVAAAGLVSVFVFALVSAADRAFCLGCLGTYVLVAGYAGIALFGWPGVGWPDLPRGVALAGGSTLAAGLALLYPGTHTPHAAGEAGRRAVDAVAATPPGVATGMGRAEDDHRLGELVASLSPEMKQTLSDSLYLYRSSGGAGPLPPPRRLLGPASAPVRITEFTDVLCTHCADLHETLASLRKAEPEGFSVEPKQFPLDGRCNSLLRPGEEPTSVRCLAAQVRVCLEGHERAFDLAGDLFASQKSLTSERVFEIAKPYSSRPPLEACVASPETRTKLEADVALAGRYDPDGTPIVLINGRRGTSFGPFLYAMVLTRGSDSHPAFATLPPPNPKAHLH